jgi:tetratricopeptide (TPR) repeat protein
VAALALALVGGAAVATLGGGEESQPTPGAQRPDRPAERRRANRETPAQKAPAPVPAREPAQKPAASAAALNEEGFRLMNQGRYDEAVPVLQRAVDAADPGDLTYAYALYNLGRALRLAGRADEAVPVLERRVRIPNQSKVVKKELKQARKAAR